MKILPVLAFGAFVGAPFLEVHTMAITALSPSVTVTIGTGETAITIPAEITPLDKGWAFNLNYSSLPELTALVDGENQGLQITASGILNPDPSITYSFGVVNPFTSPLTIGFALTTPIVPTGPSTSVSASLSGSVTDAGTDGVTISPWVGTTLQKAYGNTITSLGVDLGPGFTGDPDGSSTYGPFSAGPQPGPSGIFTTLSVNLDFSVTGGGDAAAFTGKATIVTAAETAPEGGPGVAGFLAVAATLVAGSLKTRKFLPGLSS